MNTGRSLDTWKVGKSVRSKYSNYKKTNKHNVKKIIIIIIKKPVSNEK